MAEASVPVPTDGPPLRGVTASEPGDWGGRIREFSQQPAFRKALPAIITISVIALSAALYLALSQGPQRILYSNLSDGERAQVVETLETGGIDYTIDKGTGMITVSEDDLYRARMLVASDTGLASPEGASDMLDAIPLGSSRTLEGERLRLARERELMLTISAIDGIEKVRVHLATPERSVFVRENNPPSASVMVQLAGGRSLSRSQVEAIVNLVAGSVPGMTSDAVRVADQNGRLLSAKKDDSNDGLNLQREFEAKLRQQLAELLGPLLGEGNFSSQVQVELDQSEVTSARETYENEGVVRSESERNSTRTSGTGPGGVPGVPANTPPPDAELVNGPPAVGAEQEGATAAPQPTDSESAVQRNYELGREVAVTNNRPGGLVKLSVAVAVNDEALKAAAPMSAAQLESLITAAVGADDERGDQVEVVVSKFEATEIEPLAFYEQPWFATVVRSATALLAVLLVLLLAVRPLINRLRDPNNSAKKGKKEGASEKAEGDEENGEDNPVNELGFESDANGFATDTAANQFESLPQQVEMARKLASANPDRAVEALQRMIEPQSSEEAASAT